MLKLCRTLAVSISLFALAIQAQAARNVIVLIPDGCSNSIVTLSRWFKGEPLAVDSILTGAATTHMKDSVITDSASAATAFSTGKKTSNGFLSVGPRPEGVLSTESMPSDDEIYAPYATVLEAAKMRGKATGLVATSRITHATPAAFACHIFNRGLDNDIMEHMVYEMLDVAFGGGKRHLIPTSEGGKRTDGENLLNVLMDNGYQFVETRDQLMTLTSGKAWGLFASSHMQADMDRQYVAPTEPSLAEMTQKAIELLSQDEDGFFLMVEGSQVDWAGHANDPIYMITDFLAFDDAVKVALDFAQEDGDTLVLAFPDHNTGGLSVGSDYYNTIAYTATSVEDLLDPFKNMKVTSTVLAYFIGDDLSTANIQAEIVKWWGLEVTDEQVAEMLELADHVGFGYAMSEIVSRYHTVIGWTSHGHNAEDVPLWSWGAGRPVGLVDNTELAEIIFDALNVNPDELQKELFVDMAEVFSEYELDMSDQENPVIVAGKARLPVSKNVVIGPQKSYELRGIVVYSPMTGKCYVPAQAARIIRNINNPSPF